MQQTGDAVFANKHRPKNGKRHQKKRGGRFLRVLLLLLLAVILLLSGVVVWKLFFRPSPLQKTLHALFPAVSVLEEMQDGGSVLLSGSIDSDLIGQAQKNPLVLDAKISFDTSSAQLKTTLASGESAADVDVLLQDNALVLSSSLLGEDAYRMSFADLQSALEGKLTLPDGNTDSSTSEDPSDESDSSQTESLKVLLDRCWKKLEKEVRYKIAVGRIRLTDGVVLASGIRLSFDEETVSLLADVMMELWNTDSHFHDAVAVVRNSSAVEADIWFREQMQALRAAASTQRIRGNVELWEYRGYLVAVNLQVTRTWKDPSAPVQRADISASLITSENPARNPVLKGSYAEKADGQLLRTAELEYCLQQTDTGSSVSLKLSADRTDTPKNSLQICSEVQKASDGGFVLSFDAKKEQSSKTNASTDQSLWKATLNGVYRGSEKALQLSLSGGELAQNGVTLWKIDRSSLSLELQSQNPVLTGTDRVVDMQQLPLDGLRELDVKLQSALSAALDNLQASLGFSFVSYEPTLKKLQTLSLTAGGYAYDAQRGLIAVVGTDSTGVNSEISVYQAGSLQKLTAFQIPYRSDGIAFLTAHAGRLLCVASDGTWGVYDLTSGEALYRFSVDVRVLDAAFDGTYVIYTDGALLYRCCVENGENSRLGDRSYVIPTLTWDREKGQVTVWDNDPWGEWNDAVCYRLDTGYVESVAFSQDVQVLWEDLYCIVRKERIDGRPVIVFDSEFNGEGYFFTFSCEGDTDLFGVSDKRYLICSKLADRVTFTAYGLQRAWSVDLSSLLGLF